MSEPQEKMQPKGNYIEQGAVALLVVVFMIVSLVFQNPFAPGANTTKAVGVILAAGLTLIMYSFLYRDNALFKIAENLYVGVALGYGAVIIAWRQALLPEVYDPIFNAPTAEAFWNTMMHRAVPIILGILLITRLSKKYGWMSRYAYAVMVGFGSGLAIQATTHSYILKQLQAAIAPFHEALAKGVDTGAAFSTQWFLHAVLPVFGALVVMVGTVAVLFYFFFSVEHKRAGKAFSQLGILFLMIAFGASFGYTVMGRMSLLIGRMQFLLFEWLKIPQ